MTPPSDEVRPPPPLPPPPLPAAQAEAASDPPTLLPPPPPASASELPANGTDWPEAPLHPPRTVKTITAPPPPRAEHPSPRRPPIYDPAHYGYGPSRSQPDDDRTDPPPWDDDHRWARYGAFARAAAIGAVAAAAAIVGVFLLFDGGERTVETVFEFPNSGPSVVLEGEVLDIGALLLKVEPSVVTINTDVESPGRIFKGAGSGIVVSEDGLVLTNAHVIKGADRIQITFFDGTVKDAALVGSFPDDDIAVVRAMNVSGLLPAELGTSEFLDVGDDVVAIGNALDLGSTPSVTKGIVSAKGRTIESETLVLENLIQTDAAINPGNSGGPLVNAAGQVVGINTAIIDNAQSIGFAISIDVVRPLIELAVSGDADLNPDTAFLGITTISVSSLGDAVIEQFEVTATDGAFVQETLDGSPAAAAGIQRGDVIVAIDNETIVSAESVARTVRSMRPGDVVEVILERAGVTQILQVALDVRN